MKTRTFMKLMEEIEFARKHFPNNEHMLAALTEEVGELAQSLIDHSRGKQTAEEVFKEGIQVACMAIRLIEEGDKSFPYEEPEDPIMLEFNSTLKSMKKNGEI